MLTVTWFDVVLLIAQGAVLGALALACWLLSCGRLVVRIVREEEPRR